MKVLVLSSLAANTGGAVRAEYIAESLRRCGAEVHFVHPMPKALPLMLDFALSLPIYTVASLALKPDVAIAIKAYPNAGIPLLLKKQVGTKIVIDIDDLAYAYRTGVVACLSRISQQPFPSRCDLVTYHCDGLYGHIVTELGVLPEKTYRLDQGVDLRLFDPRSVEVTAQKALRERFLLAGCKVLTYVAHLDVACDLDAVLFALRLICQEQRNVKLLIVGDGALRRHFMKMARDLCLDNNVIFVGLAKREEVADYISIADACIVYYKDKPVSYYRVSMKLREYLAMGRRVICNDVGDLKEFAAWTYQTSSALGEFADKIVDVLRGNSDGREFEGQEFVQRNCSWDTIGRAFYERLVRLCA